MCRRIQIKLFAEKDLIWIKMVLRDLPFYKQEGTLYVQVREKYAPYVKTDFTQENVNIYQVEIHKEE